MTLDDKTYVYIRLKRPEGYEDVHPELVMEDAVKPSFEPEVVSYAVLRASILEEAERVCYDLGGGVTGYECADEIRKLRSSGQKRYGHHRTIEHRQVRLYDCDEGC